MTWQIASGYSREVESSRLSLRPMALADFDVRIAYFHEATDEHLERLGVDRSRLPRPEVWRESFQRNLALPLQERSEYGVVWELDGMPVGFSTADRVRFGDEAHMHLHIIDPEHRSRGLGTQFVRLTAAHLCNVFQLKHLYCEPNAFNVAPNRTLQKAGFKYVCSHEGRPNLINTYQTTTIWVYEPAPSGVATPE